MAKGRFSSPRSSSEEDRQIEQTFRQLTNSDEIPLDAPLASDPPIEAPQGPSPEGFPDLPLSESPSEEVQEPSAQDFFLPEDPEEFYPEEEEEEEDDTFLDTFLRFCKNAALYCRQHRNVVLAVACGITLVLILTVLAVLFLGSSDPYNGKILNNVFIADINVGGMTKSEAVSAVREATEDDYTQKYMVIDLDGTTLRLAPGDVAATLDVKAVVDAAYNYGRVGTQADRDQAYQDSLVTNHIIGLLPYLTLNEAYIQDVLNTYVTDATSTLTQASYDLEGSMPELSTDKFDPDAPCQTLVITTGIPGVTFDVDAVYDQILDAYSLRSFLVTVEDVTPVTDPDPVDLQQIYDQVCIDPVDATVNMSTYEAVPGSYGYRFDLEKAQKLVDQAGYGEQVRISMEYVEPEILEDEVFFRDVLGQAKTPHTSNENRNTNLRLACEAIDGLVLNPGDTFSFNDTLGQRTTEKGYKSAPAYSGDVLVDSVGGGICQVSSTLYYCTLLSDLTTVSRINHGFPATYIDYGMDATVSWGSPDFKFKNSTNFPIQIQAEVSDGYVSIQILGTDMRNYYVEMEYSIVNTFLADTEYVDYPYNNADGYQDGDVIRNGVNGYLVKTYKLKYDKETKALISRDFVANSQYKTVSRLVARVEEQPPETTTPPETTLPPETTEPPDTTVPPETTTPPTTPPTDPTDPSDPSTPSDPSDPPATNPSEPSSPETPSTPVDASEPDTDTDVAA